MYDARVFNGEKAVEIGLVDEIGNTMGVLAREYPECSLQVVPRKQPVLEWLGM